MHFFLSGKEEKDKQLPNQNGVLALSKGEADGPKIQMYVENADRKSFVDYIQCVKEVKSLMWVYVLVGNIIRGIGETPIMPLGISYIEDFSKSENSPLYIGQFEIVEYDAIEFKGLIETGAIIGPLIGLSLASFCANVYVDIESVNTDFLPFMKSLLCNPIYMLFILISVLQFNAFVSMISFMPKYMEQHYGKSASEAIFLLAGIPAPIYFGALVDYTCLHWGTLKCGESGACRIYDSNSFRKYRLPEENASSETMLVAKYKGKENEGKEVDQNAKVLNDDELKTKL
ncbi:hypothetical protein MJT46_002202 [Ovis ammon polii x Ovis aries]|nr:hypothetical protein MJT46_002202 [Ovis ammon polii x Ovis aries]